MAAIMGYVLWDEVPTAQTMVGMCLIAGSGLYIGYRETKSAHRGDTPPPTAEASFVPGNPAPPAESGSVGDQP